MTVTSGYYLQDGRGLVGDNIMWWATGGGYTSDLRKAEVFSQSDADGQHRCRPSDIPWPAGYVGERTYLAVDMQYLGPTRVVDGECYAQAPGQWVGNDCLWLTADGRNTTDLRHAAVLLSVPSGYVAWPKSYIDRLARPAVRARETNVEGALAGTGILLTPSAKVRHPVYRCGGCGRFMAVADYYTAPCGCGTDNRP